MSEADADRLAAESLAAGDPTGWFDRLYAEAARGAAVVPWERTAPHGLLVDWTEGHRVTGAGRRAVVVGCGYGRDAEHVVGLGFATTAFDVSPTAVAAARQRHPGSAVDYRAADLFDLPAGWRHAFDLVVESMTVQALPPDLRPAAIAAVGGLVAPGGTLLVIAVGRDEGGVPAGPPWPLTRAEVDAFAAGGLRPVRVEGFQDAEGVRRWRAEFRHAG
ncbi:class I SAM-dependent methyltransferase [Micromonospora endolithica]|uniref:Class I SAM-dependent methyltransferase n=1 Tax=Micromonospora endolithica TaxID=230091 RepID=A0A3A9ZAT8_9ACTN|nr:class I SAM-dependent methyltransferase [Micromonospora endolithica]RKN45430.1 class I SAM-dependent methyltransferase [Micromonospora endolithica]TWJ22848.1 methyltransferase family protein [Micromonospora endolithica]